MKRFTGARRPMVTEMVRPLEAFWSPAHLFVLFGVSYCLPNQGAGGLVPFPAVSSAPGRAGRHGVGAERIDGCSHLPSQTVHAERRDCIAYLCSSCNSQESGTGQTRNSVKNEIIVI